MVRRCRAALKMVRAVQRQSGPGKANREGISIMQLTVMFPDEASATAWFEALVWPDGRHCPRCGCMDTRDAAATAGLPYYCVGCQKTFLARIGTALERSKVTLRQWLFAIYLEMTSLKGMSSMKLHRDIGVKQKIVWFMLHRIREAVADGRQGQCAPLAPNVRSCSIQRATILVRCQAWLRC